MNKAQFEKCISEIKSELYDLDNYAFLKNHEHFDDVGCQSSESTEDLISEHDVMRIINKTKEKYLNRCWK